MEKQKKTTVEAREREKMGERDTAAVAPASSTCMRRRLQPRLGAAVSSRWSLPIFCGCAGARLVFCFCVLRFWWFSFVLCRGVWPASVERIDL